MIVAFDEDLLAPMLAGWQKVADCYRLRVYLFRAARKIFAVTDQEQDILHPPVRTLTWKPAAGIARREARSARTATALGDNAPEATPGETGVASACWDQALLLFRVISARPETASQSTSASLSMRGPQTTGSDF
jgi:hypothetical protein